VQSSGSVAAKAINTAAWAMFNDDAESGTAKINKICLDRAWSDAALCSRDGSRAPTSTTRTQKYQVWLRCIVKCMGAKLPVNYVRCSLSLNNFAVANNLFCIDIWCCNSSYSYGQSLSSDASAPSGLRCASIYEVLRMGVSYTPVCKCTPV
jgi:hypothetical protein